MHALSKRKKGEREVNGKRKEEARMERDPIRMEMNSDISDIYFSVFFQFLRLECKWIEYVWKRNQISRISIFLFSYFQPFLVHRTFV